MVDFAELKTRVSLEQAAQYLGLSFKREGDQLRSNCPQCKPDDKRILVLTPSKGVGYCHAAKTGFDCIGLVAHVRGIRMLDAAKELAQRYSPLGDDEQPRPRTEKPRTNGATTFDPEKYFADLNPHAPELEPLGLNLDVIANFGGLCTKGVLRGTLALALRRPDGSTFGFIGIPMDAAVKWPAIFRNTAQQNTRS